MASNFLSVNQILLINNIYRKQGMQLQPCPDQLYGRYLHGSFSVQSRDNVDYDPLTGIAQYSTLGKIANPIIAIVLESPHIKEYVGRVPVGPAAGSTGKLFNRYFQTLFQASSISPFYNSCLYDVVLMNSVQFQCSLGLPLNNSSNKLDRDRNWLDIFNNHGGSADIVDRLKALNPELIINLCTKGYSNLQMILDRQLRSSLSYPYTYGTHPSTWNFSYAKIF